MEVIWNILRESWQFLLMSSPYLLLGLVVSGIIRSFLSPEIIARYLGSNSVKSVLYAALFGVPLPLCSCGVVPTAIALRKQGASRGAVLAFLISTPESGVDSIAMTYALIDPIMAVTRPIAAFVSGITAGILDIFWGTKTEESHAAPKCEKCVDLPMEHPLPKHLGQKLKEGFQFSFVTLLNDISGWFLLGVGLAGVIGALVPQTLIENYLGGGFASMMIILAISIPLYICAAGSTPIAAALMLKGMSPGAALVLLMAGPATNAASLAVLSRFLGLRSTMIYLGTIAVMSVAFGYALDGVYSLLHITPSIAHHAMDHSMQNAWELPSAIVLIVGIVAAKINAWRSVQHLISFLNYQANPSHWRRLRAFFLLSFFYTFFAVVTAYLLFPSETGIVSVFLQSFALLPAFDYILEKNRTDIWEKKCSSVHANTETAWAIMSLMLGAFFVYLVISLYLPASLTETAFLKQLDGAPRHLTQMNFSSFVDIFRHNVAVLFIFLFFSMVYRSGAIFVVVWNASVWGCVLGYIAKTVHSGPIFFVCFMPHMIAEASSYILASMAGLFFSKGISKYSWSSDAFHRVLGAAFFLFCVSILLLLIAAGLESVYTPFMVKNWLSRH